MDRARYKSAAAPLAITIAACLATLLPVQPERDRRDGARQAAPPPAREEPATPEVIALLDGLRPGDPVGDLRVRRISAPRGRAISVDLEGGGRAITLRIAVRGALPHTPPRQTARYDLFYESARPPARALEPEAIGPLLAALAERIARVEERVATPPGM